MSFVDMPEDVRAFLGGLGAELAHMSPNPGLAERREALKHLAKKFGPAARVSHVEERTIPHGKQGVPIRVYRPAVLEPEPPILINFHGGGWVLGDFEAYQNVCRAYSDASGAIVVDVGYRLAPEHKFPAAFDDCVAAIEWVHAHARELGGDPLRIVVTGDSAGGNLAACACLAARVRIALQILVYPVIHVGKGLALPSREEYGHGDRFLTIHDITRAESEYLPSPRFAKDSRVNVLHARKLERAPPTLIVAAQFDPLRDEGLLLHARLKSAGVKSRYWEAPGMIHGFVLFAGAIASGRDVIQAMGAEIRNCVPR